MDLRDAVWRKSSCSTDQTECVEVAFPDWRKSSYSGSETACVEISYRASAAVGIRDSKDPDGGVLQTTGRTWRALCAAIQAGDLGPRHS
ncbi:DUF397 domain-containing protein [Haloechinothrix sp. LS1_15]|uniref:DUF397 domain-containing protein n=1 Tax=Haloechinothrix sp. LS1_15 TaxID=2652248 RepID=UPI002947C371|nr:DUF397 domain-containing protein [Haloechinothrix sp. LS1_15]MDV6012449.1 DUF397 domain-containing protein [Haloechinothrix sp. LS1_15]